ncbi:Hint domain-containing protein [Ancylobacter sonchi]|uniref:Hint domain-containing protein n=1 Tax=Ancylobacter sonchi TaxID=1937790 RepID=UPI001FE43677|nr:Hint domain-containing protein [Ancylobacter sonchi]
MATFVSVGVAPLTPLGGGSYALAGPLSPLQYSTTDGNAADDAFTVNEPLVASNSVNGDFGFTYLSFYKNGWIGEIDGSYFFFTNDSYVSGDTITPTAASFVVCFLAGTMIATPSGEVAIEALKSGDLVLTTSGEARPVRWLARQTVSTVFFNRLTVLPIRVCAGALAENQPVRDLFVSADHALELDGILIQAGALVNGTTILRHTDVPQTFVYYHIELEDHSLILAEGVPAETFVDNVTRRRFDNWHEAPQAPIAEMDRPRIKSARQMPAAIRARLDVHAEELSSVAA